MIDVCSQCGFPMKEHAYSGACYGVCGVFAPMDFDEKVRLIILEQLRRAYPYKKFELTVKSRDWTPEEIHNGRTKDGWKHRGRDSAGDCQ